jgi:predicted P-loop ATPase
MPDDEDGMNHDRYPDDNDPKKKEDHAGDPSADGESRDQPSGDASADGESREQPSGDAGKQKKNWFNTNDPEGSWRSNVIPLKTKQKRNQTGWRKDLQKAEGSDVALCNLFNAMIVMRHHDPLKQIVRFDEMMQTTWLFGQIPGTQEDRTIPRPLRDNDVLSIQEEIQRAELRRLNKETARDAIALRSHEMRYNPLLDYLNGLTWDGKPRLETWTHVYLGVKNTPYSRAIGRMFLIAMVARAIDPGCKMDYMVVLEGPQGAGKSQACQILAGDWFSDSLPDVAHGDHVRLAMHLRGKWLVEIGELASISKAESSELKLFLSKREERYLPKYAHNEVIEPRRCVFIGTTNELMYLKDPTGDRRYWPLTVGEIMLDLLRQDRDQLFAEAVKLFREGCPHYPDPTFEAEQIVPQQEARRDEDAWEGTIRKWLDGGLWEDPYGVTINRAPIVICTVFQIATEALNIPAGNISRAVQMRVSAIITGMGWEKVHRKTGVVFKRPKNVD